MRRGIVGALVAMAAATLVSVAHGQGLAPHSCAWLFRLSGDQVNAAFPDSAARYWVAQIPLPPGYHADIAARFPHARYISFIDYDAASRAIDGIADYEIAPDPGSTNPFVPLADRTATQRSYVVHVRNEVMPAAGRATNTIYTETPAEQTKTSRPTNTALVVYRVYEPDQAYGADITGGVGLPEISIVADDGSSSTPIPDCDDRSLPDLGLTQQLAGNGPGAGNDSLPSTGLGSRNPPIWIRYTNAVNGVANGVLNNETTGDAAKPAIDATNTIPRGGFYENVHNAYMTAFDSSSFGDILVFHGKAPVTPDTYDNTAVMPDKVDLRYWSMCSNMSTTQFLACIKDDDTPLDATHSFTVVVSTAATRPQSAQKSCGIAWLPKGPLPSAPIILRNMLPSAPFPYAIQNVAQGDEHKLGDYYPRGIYFQHAANFDAFVNANGGCQAFTWPATDPPTYRPPGLPVAAG